ncbi:MAG TPA: amino acid adenylation domain-containing protein, partial [Thermoanaerobaculia bacterium]|nr:amino acid adenylation domain-containing protein [Thermoanaerobaculia bacterium]
RRSFDLAAGPLLRAAAVRIGRDDHALLLALHHVIADGWSMGVLFRELEALYRLRLGSAPGARPPELAALPIQYADFALWQRRWLSGEVLAGELAFWRERLAGAPPVLELPADRPRPAVRAAHGGVLSWRLPEPATEGLRGLARERGASLFIALLAGFQALLARVTGATDLSVGTPVANRTGAETEGLIGFFTNTLVLRADLGGDPTFAELLERMREVALEAFGHQELPFEKLVQELRPERRMSHTPLVQVMLALQNVPEAAADLPGLRMAPVPLDWHSAKFDLTVVAREAGGALAGQAEFDRALFDPTSVRRLLGAFTTLLEGAAADPRRRLSELPLLDASARHQLLVEWNDSRSRYPRAGLGELLAARIARSPDAVAVCFPDGGGPRSLTYGELGRRAEGVARRLRALGAGPEVPVAIAVERSLEMVVGIAGIALAGAAYLPLDPDYPEERLRFMLEDAGAPVVVVAGAAPAALAGSVAATGAALLDLLRAPAEGAVAGAPLLGGGGAGPAHLAYVTYTSGSTGRPKGVAVPQGAVARLVLDADYLAFGPDRRIGQVSTPSFDAATFELWGALLHGATLVGIGRDLVLDPPRLAAELARRRVTTLFLTTALFNQLVQAGAELPEALAGLDELLFGGEACDPERVRQALAPGVGPRRLLHVYGPTESTTFASWLRVSEVPPGAATVAIGRPLASTTLHVVDRRLRPAPVAVAGELAIGGDGLARGYWRRPAPTAERFVPDPLSGRPGGRLYRTGDLVRLDASGRIE